MSSRFDNWFVQFVAEHNMPAAIDAFDENVSYQRLLACRSQTAFQEDQNIKQGFRTCNVRMVDFGAQATEQSVIL